MYYAIDFILILPMHVTLFMEQKGIPQVCTALENHAFCVDSCDFFAFNSNTVCSMWYVTFFAFVHIGE